MNRKRRLGRRYGVISVVCLALLIGLTHHEFIIEPEVLGQENILEHFGSYTWSEIIFHLLVPGILIAGWVFMGNTLHDVERFAKRVELVHSGNLNEPLPSTGTGDELDRLATVFNDMTHRLSEAFQHIREFTLNASHELKTPLTVMGSQIETMLRDAPDWTPTQQEWLRAQLDEVQRMARIGDSLTLLTKADAGLIQMEMRPVDLRELVQECVSDVEVLAEPYAIQVEFREYVPAMISGDRDRLRQLLLNLADNAVKYNEVEGAIWLTLRTQASHAEFQIANTGPGFTSSLHGQIFERFVRGSDVLQRGIDGCGLGLSICQWIVQAHGGELSIASTPGGWTTARVLLPLQENARLSTPQTAESAE